MMNNDGDNQKGGLDPRNYFPSKESDFFPAGGSDNFDATQGALRRQLIDRGNFLFPMEGYRILRPAMKRAFAAVSRDGTDNGWIEDLDEFKQLMLSVGEDLSEVEFERLFRLCMERPSAFRGQRKNSIVFEQWVNVMESTKNEVMGPDDKLFGIF